jgi:hypothetical protein
MSGKVKSKVGLFVLGISDLMLGCVEYGQGNDGKQPDLTEQVPPYNALYIKDLTGRGNLDEVLGKIIQINRAYEANPNPDLSIYAKNARAVVGQISDKQYEALTPLGQIMVDNVRSIIPNEGVTDMGYEPIFTLHPPK